jgi:hypothetical protein
MKKMKILSLIIAGALIIMFSCTKENNESVIKNETNDCPSCKAGIELANRINKFKERLAYAKENVYKDGDEMTKEEAIENMEMLFNASYGFPAESYIQLKRDTVELTLPVNSQGYIQTTDVATTYDNMHTQVKTVYDNIIFNDKHLVSLSIKENEGNQIQVISTTGEKGTDPSNFTHCWIYGEDEGYCFEPDPYQYEKDGGDAIAEKIFANRPIPMYCPEGYHGITIQDYAHTFTGEGGTFGSGYMFYLQKASGIQFTDEERRLEAEEMNSWYDKEYEFLFTVLPESLNKPENWIMTSIKIDAYEHFSQNPNIHWINHPNDVEYGLFYCVPDNEIDPPVDL